MGQSSSSISELASNELLLTLSAQKSLGPNDPFWNQLLSFSFQVPRTSADQRLLEEATSQICKNFSINNCQTGNFGSLVRVFLVRASELKASAQCEDNIFTWQTYNALFIIRSLCKYFVENLSEEVVVQQFETKTMDSKGEAEVRGPLTDELMSCLIEVLVDVPLVEFTYAIHLECLNTLLILLSMQMFQPTPAAATSHIYTAIMNGRCSIHACLLMKTLLQNYMDQVPCPANMRVNSSSHGMLYGVTAAVASGIWNVMTLGLANRGADRDEEEEVSDKLLANQSLLLILVLANHCTGPSPQSNPYRQALFSFTDSQAEAGNSSPTEAVATFKIDLGKLYDTLSSTLKEDQTTLLMYLLLHRNAAVKAYFLSRTNIETLVMPILKILYAAQEKNSHHIYMALIVLLILSEDSFFNKAVHETSLKHVAWFKERSISDLSLGGLLILVVIRTIQYNMTRMRDKYLHTNCLAALANMSSQFKDLHPYVAQRLVSLFKLLQKKHDRLVEKISEAAVAVHNTSGTDSDTENDYVEDLGVVEEVIRMVLEIINSCLCHQLPHNPNLVYTLLYQKDLFNVLRTHPTFQDIIQNIDTVLTWFSQRLEKEEKNMSVNQVIEIIKQGAMQFQREKLKKFPELKFKYVEEEQPEEFFIPYVWSLVYHSSNLYFNPARIQLFSMAAGTNAQAT